MAFVDTGTMVYGGVNPGAPSGGGVVGSVNAGASVQPMPGSGGLGSGLAVHHWALIYVGLIVATLVVTGVLFNGKGRK